MYRVLLPLALLMLPGFMTAASASSSLLFLESQLVGGYSSAEKEFIPYSMSQNEVMQKPSVGFDFIQRFSSETGDFASMAIQGRLAYDPTYEKYIEPQLYNAYVKAKLPGVDVWAGHSRPASGLSSYLDSHGLLLHTLAMMGFGYDRDWGGGVVKEFPGSELQFSLTTGSGMPLYLKGNYLASGRFGLGVLSQDNFTVGVSASYGEVLDTVGYELMDDSPVNLRLAGADLTYLWDRYEARLEGMTGSRMDEPAYAFFARLGVSLLEEGRLKVEFQPAYTKSAGIKNYELAGGLTVLAMADLSLRAMYRYDYSMDDHRIVVQAYYYGKLL
jgi:hypothetical protein